MDWNYWLGRKYANLDQATAADTTRAQAGLISANAGATLDTTRAGLLPAESRANIALTGAQTRLADANVANTNETTKYIGPRANAEIYATRQQGGLYGAQATGETQLNTMGGFKFGGANSLEERLQGILKRLGIGLPAVGQ